MMINYCYEVDIVQIKESCKRWKELIEKFQIKLRLPKLIKVDQKTIDQVIIS